MIHVVEARPYDTHIACRMWKQMVLEKRPDWNPRPDWWMEISYNLFISGLYTQLIAYDDTTPVGFMDFFVMPEPSTGEIHGVGQHLYVIPEARGKFVAGRLIREAKKIAGKKGVTVVDLFTFSDEVDQWAKCGYRPARVLMRSEFNV